MLEDSKAHSRSLSAIKTYAKNKPPKEYTQQPLLKIKLDHVVADELHLLLRITDRLIDALVHQMAQLDYTCRVQNTWPTISNGQACLCNHVMWCSISSESLGKVSVSIN